MKQALPLFFVAFAVVAHAAPLQSEPVRLAPFEARVRLADATEADERFKTYRPAMFKRAGRKLAGAMRSCIAASSKSDKNSVTLVADIGADGKATTIEVQPDNAVAQCFASRFSSISYPKPPAYPERSGFPVAMRINVAR